MSLHFLRPAPGRCRDCALWRRLLDEEDGQTLVEYGLLISFIALAVITALSIFGRKISNYYNAAGNQLPQN